MPAEYSPGDRIIYSDFGEKPGRVVKCARVTAVVRLDGRAKDERVPVHRLRPETVEDVAKREHEAAMRAWNDIKPSTLIARVDYFFGYGPVSDRQTGASASAKNPAEMRLAARELELLASWFEKKPAAMDA